MRIDYTLRRYFDEGNFYGPMKYFKKYSENLNLIFPKYLLNILIQIYNIIQK